MCANAYSYQEQNENDGSNFIASTNSNVTIGFTLPSATKLFQKIF